MEEQVELDFTIKAEVKTMQDLVEMLNNNHLVEILTVTDGSTDRQLSGQAFMYLPHNTFSSSEKWEYKVGLPPEHTYSSEHFESWLNELGQDGWEIMQMPDEDGWWFFKRKTFR